MSAVTSPIAGTRIEPNDSYMFMKGTQATFKTIFTDDSRPILIDIGYFPEARIIAPRFLQTGAPLPPPLAILQGSLVSGQTYEYQFVWDIPADQFPNDEYIISYSGRYGGININFGDEYFSITSIPGQIGLKFPSYATVADVRMQKFNIDSYLPPSIKNDTIAKNNLIETHLRNATTKLREELNLSKSRGNTENYRLFCVYYTIYTILLASRGEDGSSVSDSNLSFWRREWEKILAREIRESCLNGIALGRG